MSEGIVLANHMLRTQTQDTRCGRSFSVSGGPCAKKTDVLPPSALPRIEAKPWQDHFLEIATAKDSSPRGGPATAAFSLFHGKDAPIRCHHSPNATLPGTFPRFLVAMRYSHRVNVTSVP